MKEKEKDISDKEPQNKRAEQEKKRPPPRAGEAGGVLGKKGVKPKGKIPQKNEKEKKKAGVCRCGTQKVKGKQGVGGAGHTAGGTIEPENVKGADQKTIEKVKAVKVKEKK